MSGAPQRSKRLKGKGLYCGNRSKFESLADAKAYIETLINKEQRGAKTLHAFPCETCSRRTATVIHVGHRRRVTN